MRLVFGCAVSEFKVLRIHNFSFSDKNTTERMSQQYFEQMFQLRLTVKQLSTSPCSFTQLSHHIPNTQQIFDC